VADHQAQTQTHDLTFSGGEVRKRYVTWSRGEADREWACLSLLAEHAPGVAPRPIRRETDGDAPVIVMERLPGSPSDGTPLTPEQTRSLGAVLRRMYDVPLAAIHDAGVTERQYGPTALAGEMTLWLSEDYDLDQCLEPVVVRDAVTAALEWLADPTHLPDPVLDSLGISDLNPANVLLDGSSARLVDFEDGGLTDPAYELADHVEHLGGRLTNTYDAKALVAAVGLTDEQQVRMSAYRPLWATFWLAMLLPGNGGFRRNPRGTTESQARHLFNWLGASQPLS
jgi:aminoglycoside phosphotransferase (APT) family kinase protein